MKIVFFGTPHFVTPVLETIKQNFDLVGIVTSPDQKVGRKQLITPSPIKEVANNIPNITILTPDKLDKDAGGELQKLAPDLFVVAAYGKIIPQSILDIPKYGSINIHPSLLPKYRGPSPLQSTILNGDTVTGVTLIQMDSEVDHGPILLKEEVQLTGNETFATLADQLFQLSTKMLPDVVNKFTNNELQPEEQNHANATFCEHIEKKDGYIDIINPPDPKIVDCMIRAYFPWPTVWTHLHQDFGGQAKKGKIIKFLPGEKVQLEGRKPMRVKEFLNGYPEAKEFISKLFP